MARRGELVIERDPGRPSGRLLRQGGMDASYVDLADPTHLEFDYMRWMRIVLEVARARRVLHIGGAGCALPRALASVDPGARQQVCELDAEVLELARQHLGLKRIPGLRVRHCEGRGFLSEQPAGSWDAVVIDAFIGAVVPRHLITLEAAQEMARVAPLALVNVVDGRAGREVRLIAAAVAGAFPRGWAIGSRAGNTVVGGGPASLDLNRINARIAADPSPARVVTPTTLSRLAAAGLPLRDHEIPVSQPAPAVRLLS